MKKSIALLFVVFALGASVAKAEIKFSIKELDLIVPFTQTETVYLYDIIGKKGMAGLETPIVAFRKLEATVGAVTDAEWEGAPFVGLRYLVPGELFSDRFYFGLWGGRDFRRDAYQAGIKASIRLW
jgi:hypothetical protein